MWASPYGRSSPVAAESELNGDSGSRDTYATYDDDESSPMLPPPRAVRKPKGRMADVVVAVVLPWLIFFLVVGLFIFAYNQLKVVVWCLVGMCFLLSLLFLVVGWVASIGSFIAIGFLCFTAVTVGNFVGLWLHAEYLERYWELEGATTYSNVSPVGNAAPVTGPGILHFTPDTFVDDRRTMGFVAEGSIFCVAPVARFGQPDDAVQYWAVGEDCCEQRSNFDCGSAREVEALTAITERPRKIFDRAIAQAVAVYGTNVAAAPRLVSFVSDPNAVISDIWQEALILALVALIMDFVMCLVGGVVVAQLILPSERQPFRKMA